MSGGEGTRPEGAKTYLFYLLLLLLIAELAEHLRQLGKGLGGLRWYKTPCEPLARILEHLE